MPRQRIADTVTVRAATKTLVLVPNIGGVVEIQFKEL